MSVGTFFEDLVSGGKKVADFLTTVANGAKTLATIWSKLSGPTLAAAQAVFYDVVKTAAAAESAGAAAASGNVLGAVTLSETTISLVKQVVADGKVAESVVAADLKALGIKL